MPKYTANGADVYKKWHWGIKHTRVIEWDMSRFGLSANHPVIECGRLCELHVKAARGTPAFVINVAQSEVDKAHLVFDPRQPNNPLYTLTSPSINTAAKRAFWDASKAIPLSQIAKDAGGRHANRYYPHIKARPIGHLTHVTYLTEKKGDGVSQYIHELAEMKTAASARPILAVDSTGQFWLCGGSYTSPTPGISD